MLPPYYHLYKLRTQTHRSTHPPTNETPGSTHRPGGKFSSPFHLRPTTYIASIILTCFNFARAIIHIFHLKLVLRFFLRNFSRVLADTLHPSPTNTLPKSRRPRTSKKNISYIRVYIYIYNTYTRKKWKIGIPIYTRMSVRAKWIKPTLVGSLSNGK